MLTQKLKEILEEMADAFADYTELKYPITDVNKLIKDIGGQVVYDTQMQSFDEARGIKTKRGFKIMISPSKSCERHTYEVILELSKMMLFMGLISDDKMWDSQQYYTEYKYKDGEAEQTRYLADAILMPRTEFRQKLKEHSKGNTVYTRYIADDFRVPPDVARGRGLELGLIDW